MLRRIYDIFMFTAYGFLKTSLFLSLFCLSISFFLKSKNIFHIEIKSIEFLGALANPTDRIKQLGSTNAESMGLKTDEADIFKFILLFYTPANLKAIHQGKLDIQNNQIIMFFDSHFFP